MTKPQIWVAAFLTLFIALFILQKALQNDNENIKMPGEMMTGETETQQNVSGDELVKQWGCISCHGTDLNGTKLAPPLSGLSEYWSRDELINYLRNPQAYMSSERFREYKQKYPGSIMPAYGNKNIQELGKVADFLLSR
ncbi:MAG: hypothetical protein Kow0098_06530 [Ignavibacteriaceae bacterium]